MARRQGEEAAGGRSDKMGAAGAPAGSRAAGGGRGGVRRRACVGRKGLAPGLARPLAWSLPWRSPAGPTGVRCAAQLPHPCRSFWTLKHPEHRHTRPW